MSFVPLAELLRGSDAGEMSALPYARTLGLRFRRSEDGITIAMPFTKKLLGAPSRLHGGTVAGLLEIASLAQLLEVLRNETPPPLIKPINVTVDYLRAAATEETFALAIVTRLGRRIANVRAEAWQADRTLPIAAAHMNVLLVRDETA